MNPLEPEELDPHTSEVYVVVRCVWLQCEFQGLNGNLWGSLGINLHEAANGDWKKVKWLRAMLFFLESTTVTCLLLGSLSYIQTTFKLLKYRRDDGGGVTIHRLVLGWYQQTRDHHPSLSTASSVFTVQ